MPFCVLYDEYNKATRGWRNLAQDVFLPLIGLNEGFKYYVSSHEMHHPTVSLHTAVLWLGLRNSLTPRPYAKAVLCHPIDGSDPPSEWL